jgi:hypothetical protein
LQGVSAEAQNPSADQRLEREQSPVAGRQRRGLLITNSLTGAGRLDYIKAFLSCALFFFTAQHLFTFPQIKLVKKIDMSAVLWVTWAQCNWAVFFSS